MHTYKYPAKGELKGIVYLLHGLYAYSNQNAIIARILSEHGFEVLSIDLRGHGKSEGIPGYLESGKVVLQDINNFIKITEKEYEGKTPNKFILGYSFGGLLANLIALEKKDYFSGLILLAPAFHSDEGKYSFWIKIGRILNFIAPSLPLTHIKEKIEEDSVRSYIKNDPLMYKGKLRVATGLTIIDSINFF